MGYESVADDFDDRRRARVHAPDAVNLEDLKQPALENRPDVQAAQRRRRSSRRTRLALENGNRARDVDGNLGLHRTLGPDNSDRRRRRRSTCRSTIATRATSRTAQIAVAPGGRDGERRRGSTALTDVVNAYAPFQTSREDRRPVRVRLSRSGASSRSTSPPTSISAAPARCSTCSTPNARIARRELAYRQALAAYMTSLQQLNFAVGKQVIP